MPTATWRNLGRLQAVSDDRVPIARRLSTRALPWASIATVNGSNSPAPEHSGLA
jgi:hypothetical protein